jgi:hypothetical protein
MNWIGEEILSSEGFRTAYNILLGVFMLMQFLIDVWTFFDV